jgi:hypothetical protein
MTSYLERSSTRSTRPTGTYTGAGPGFKALADFVSAQFGFAWQFGDQGRCMILGSGDPRGDGR